MKGIDEALSFIHGASKFGIKLGLSGISDLLDGMGHPEKDLKFIHIAGTNGKGSVATFIAQSLIEAGYDVGKYTSPHITSFNERINLNGVDISDDDLVISTKSVKEVVEKLRKEDKQPTEFEIITAIAFDYFNRKKVDVVVLETGLGGRFDSTNVVDPILCVISKIALDHTDRLGNTIEEIAFEKAGIIKPGVPVCTCLQEEPALEVILNRAREVFAPVFNLAESDIPSADEVKFSLDGTVFTYLGEDYEIGMLGRYQVLNSILALLSLKVLNDKTDFNVPKYAIKKGLKNARWQARFELLSKSPIVIADGAHNLNGVRALKESINIYFGDEKLKAIFAVMRDKDLVSMILEIGDSFDEIYVYTANVERAMDKSDISIAIQNTSFKGKVILLNSMTEMIELFDKERVYIAFGSLYFISEIKGLFEGDSITV